MNAELQAMSSEMADAAMATIVFGPHSTIREISHWLHELKRCDPSREYELVTRCVSGKPVSRFRAMSVPTIYEGNENGGER